MFLNISLRQTLPSNYSNYNMRYVYSDRVNPFSSLLFVLNFFFFFSFLYTTRKLSKTPRANLWKRDTRSIFDRKHHAPRNTSFGLRVPAVSKHKRKTQEKARAKDVRVIRFAREIRKRRLREPQRHITEMARG